MFLGLDDTIDRRRGKRITAKGIHRDPVRCSDSHFVKANGLRWMSQMVLAPTLHGCGSGVLELALRHRGDAFRVVYAVQTGDDVWGLHAYSEDIQVRHRHAESGDRPDCRTPETPEGGPAMSDDFDLVRGSGNVFRDLDLPNPDLEQLRSILAGQIVKTLDARRWSVREAEAQTGTPYADFSRIRNARLDRFTVDKLMTILSRLDQQVSVSVEVQPRAAAIAALPQPQVI